MKKLFALCMALIMLLPLAGCMKTGGATPLEEAYNAVYNARRDIKGFDMECIYYNSDKDWLQLYAYPGVDYGAVVQILEDTVAGREVNRISLRDYVDPKDYKKWTRFEPLLEAFSLHFSAPVSQLELGAPEMTPNGIAQPALWRESLARIQNVGELILHGATIERGSGSDYSYLQELADGASFGQYATIAVNTDTGELDVTGLEVFSGMKRLVVGYEDTHSVTAPSGVVGLEQLDAELTTVDVSLLNRSLMGAKLAYRLRSMGYTVEGIAQDPRESLNQNDTTLLMEYDTFVAEYGTLEALQADDGSFLTQCKEFFKETGGWSETRIEAGLALLQRFYGLAGTPEFEECAAFLCAYDAGLKATPHSLILQNVVRYVQDGAEAIIRALPQSGDWCKDMISITIDTGETTTVSVLNALMKPYPSLLYNEYVNDGERREITDAIEQKHLIAGTLVLEYCTGEPKNDFALVQQLISNGAMTEAEAYDTLLAATNGLDPFLEAVTLWDAQYDTPVRVNWPIDKVENLSFDDYHFKPERFGSRASQGETADGRTALLAIKSEDDIHLVATPVAYMMLGEEDGRCYRAIPKGQTPKSAEEAQMIIIAYIAYEYAFSYTDGTPGYASVADVYAYDVATRECLSYLGQVKKNSPEKMYKSESQSEVRANMPIAQICELVSGWMHG